MTEKQIREEIEKITDDYGQLHKEECDLNSEGGSYEGCDCAMRGLVEQVVSFIINN